MNYEVIIGLEVHAQLNTKSKLFCRCSIEFGADPNSQTCIVCQGHPGVLPALNHEALKKTIQTGIAFNCEINYYSKFDRKNYFYPDLPKAYQISQYEFPLCKKGQLIIDINNTEKIIGINRVHLEEDAGKLIHAESHESYIDLNRSGVPLLEIVSEPSLRTSEEAYQYLSSLKQILQYIQVSDCNMEKGSLRCDANISLRKMEDSKFGVKTEIKNLNSFRNVQKALEYEIRRQTRLIDNGKKIKQETRFYDADKNITEVMRNKEAAHNYRYFPDPDLVPINLQRGYVEKLRNKLPELPRQKQMRFMQSYNLSKKHSYDLIAIKEIADFYEQALLAYSKNPKRLANWIMVEVMKVVNDLDGNINKLNIKPKELAYLVKAIDEEKISGKMGKQIFEQLVKNGGSVVEIINKFDLKLINDQEELEKIVKKVIKENSTAVSSYKSGQRKAIGFLIGSAMKITKGQADPKILHNLLSQKLNK